MKTGINIKSCIQCEKRINNENGLTEKQKRILNLFSRGFNAKEIGNKMNISSRTVEGQKRAIFEKLEANNIANAVYIGCYKGIIKFD